MTRTHSSRNESIAPATVPTTCLAISLDRIGSVQRKTITDVVEHVVVHGDSLLLLLNNNNASLFSTVLNRTMIVCREDIRHRFASQTTIVSRWCGQDIILHPLAARILSLCIFTKLHLYQDHRRTLSRPICLSTNFQNARKAPLTWHLSHVRQFAAFRQ
jgi:hypothetical protein